MSGFTAFHLKIRSHNVSYQLKLGRLTYFFRSGCQSPNLSNALPMFCKHDVVIGRSLPALLLDFLRSSVHQALTVLGPCAPKYQEARFRPIVLRGDCYSTGMLGPLGAFISLDNTVAGSHSNSIMKTPWARSFLFPEPAFSAIFRTLYRAPISQYRRFSKKTFRTTPRTRFDVVSCVTPCFDPLALLLGFDV